MTRALAVACTIVALPVTAQQPPTQLTETRQAIAQETRRQLRSPDPKEVAWGAFRAAEYRFVEVVPEIVAALEAPSAPDGSERFATVSALLDSLVQLDASVPAAVLPLFWRDWPVQTAILSAKATGDRDQMLLDWLASSSGSEWFAAANVLLDTKPPGFAAELLRNLNLRLDITVSEAGNRMTGGGGGGSAGVADGIGFNPPGYPPHARYRFESGPRPGYVVLSTGPRTIYYTRTATYQGQFGISRTFISGPSDVERFDYLMSLLDPNARNSIGLRARTSEAVAWRDADHLNQRVSTLRENIIRQYQRLISALVSAKCLTETDADLRALPHIDVAIIDRRTNQSPPLPTIK